MGAEKEIAMNPAMWGVSDLAEYQAKMQTGIENLADIHDCDVAIGETPKDAVFSIEKVTLYKYRGRCLCRPAGCDGQPQRIEFRSSDGSVSLRGSCRFLA